MDRTRTTFGAAVIAVSVLIATAAVAAAAPPSGFVGKWQTIDCAQGGDGSVDCGIWGDGSALTLTIGPGTTPHASFQDSYASICSLSGLPVTRWVASGSGAYDGEFLWVTFTKVGCGPFGLSWTGVGQFYHDAGSDTIWEDEDGDGWGYVWHRVP